MRMGERRHHTHTQETCPSQVDDRRRVFFSRVILLLGAFARSNLLDWARVAFKKKDEGESGQMPPQSTLPTRSQHVPRSRAALTSTRAGRGWSRPAL